MSLWYNYLALALPNTTGLIISKCDGFGNNDKCIFLPLISICLAVPKWYLTSP